MPKPTTAEIRQAILHDVPLDGSSIGNMKLRDMVSLRLGEVVDEGSYYAARDALVDERLLTKGQGRGGSVRRLGAPVADLVLESPEVPASDSAAKPQQPGLALNKRKPGAPTRVARRAEDTKVIAYQHDNRRTNNPEVGMVDPDTDPGQPKTTWAYDPHIDPTLQFDVGRARVESLIDRALADGNDHAVQARDELLAWIDHALAGQDEAAIREVVTNLRGRIAKEKDVRPEAAALEQLKRQAAPYLNWTGKAERTSFEVDTVSLHVHERIDPATILAAVRKRLKQGVEGAPQQQDWLRAWFEQPLAYRDAIEFYKHDRGWANRLVAGDSLQVMNSLLHKEGMAGQVQMIYIDPPYGIKYGSNFQPFVNKRDVKDRKDEDLTQEPEMIKAFRDTWELGIHSYLTYLRDRLLLAKELLHESGSVFLQISDENVHHVRELMDEVFGLGNFIALIAFKKTATQTSEFISGSADYIVWYAKDRAKLKYQKLYTSRLIGEQGSEAYTFVEQPDNSRVALGDAKKRFPDELPEGFKSFRLQTVLSAREGRPSGAGTAMAFEAEFNGRRYVPSGSQGWKTTSKGMERLGSTNRIQGQGNSLAYVRYIDDFPVMPINNLWMDTQSGSGMDKQYVVQTNTKVIERCLLMTTDPGDLVLDPTCGSGTTAFVAEKWGRR